MSDLTRFRDHARTMAKPGTHRTDCATERRPDPHWGGRRPKHAAALAPICTGCVTDDERALWQRLADETDAYLDRHPEETLL